MDVSGHRLYADHRRPSLVENDVRAENEFLKLQALELHESHVSVERSLIWQVYVPERMLPARDISMGVEVCDALVVSTGSILLGPCLKKESHIPLHDDTSLNSLDSESVLRIMQVFHAVRDEPIGKGGLDVAVNECRCGAVWKAVQQWHLLLDSQTCVDVQWRSYGMKDNLSYLEHCGGTGSCLLCGKCLGDRICRRSTVVDDP